MRKLTTKLSILFAAIFFSCTINAQKVETSIKYVQFPTEGKIMKTAYLEFADTETGVMGAVNRIAQQVAGQAGGPTTATVSLCSPIFFSEGDLSVMVNAREPKQKELFDFMKSTPQVVFGKDLENTSEMQKETIRSILSFQVFKGESLIFEQDPINIIGYKPSQSQSVGSVSEGIGASLQQASNIQSVDYFPHEELAKAYITKALRTKYGMGLNSVGVTPYSISKLKKENKKKAQLLSEDLVYKCKQFQSKMGTEDYNKEINDALTFYLDLESQKSEDKKAEVSKKNIWQIQSNIALCYFLLEEPGHAKIYMKKAEESKNETIITKESKSGKASFSAGFNLTSLPFARSFIQACEDYQEGLLNNNTAFVEQFKDKRGRNTIDDVAQELLLSNMISYSYDIEIPVNIYDCGGKIKKVTGTIASNGNTYTYKYNKVWYSFIQKLLKKDLLYVNKVVSTTNKKDKYKFETSVYVNDWTNGNYTMRPHVARDDEFIMTKAIYLTRAANELLPVREYEDYVTKKNVKAISRYQGAVSFPMSLISESKDKVRIGVKFKTNNNIVLAIKHERDKPDFAASSIELEKEEVLFYDEIFSEYQYNNSEIESITSHSYSIVRDRAVKLPRDAKNWKKTHVDQFLPTTVVAQEEHDIKCTISDKEVNITKDGKSSIQALDIQKNGENWNAITVGDTKIKRTIL